LSISVLIATRNRAKPLARCLRSVLAQTTLPKEILIFDDGSSPSVQSQIAETDPDLVRHPLITWLRAEAHIGLVGARNVLFVQASSRLLFVLDDDAWLDDTDSISRIEAYFEAQPHVGVVALPIFDHHSGQVFPLLPFKKHHQRRNPACLRKAGPCTYFPGGAHVLNKPMLTRFGPYDGSFVYGHEELDLSYRLVEQGIIIHFLPTVEVQHERQLPLGQPAAGALFHTVRNRIRVGWRYLPLWYFTFYFALWLLYYARWASRFGRMREFFRGVMAGVHSIVREPRTPLSKSSVGLIRELGGRLYF